MIVISTFSNLLDIFHLGINTSVRYNTEERILNDTFSFVHLGVISSNFIIRRNNMIFVVVLLVLKKKISVKNREHFSPRWLN